MADDCGRPGRLPDVLFGETVVDSIIGAFCVGATCGIIFCSVCIWLAGIIERDRPKPR
jgi:hypothetical protein